MSEQLELALFGSDEIQEEESSGEAELAGNGNTASGMSGLMDLVVEPENLKAAWKRVKQNKGSPGVDGMRVDELGGWLDRNWERVRECLLSGCYVPSPVRRAEIPKAGGGVRQLGIPTVLDRLIQQMILQVLSPLIDPTFSEWSFGFRPGRSGQDAILAAHEMIQSGRRVVVDVDLKTFFDLVQHDVLMDRLSRRIGDKVLLRLIRGYLRAGILAGGLVMDRHEGTPQGGPLSPLLANILLDEIDQELERRGHSFVRYADDCNVYVRSQRAGERVMSLLRRLYGNLRLEVNEQKSAVAPLQSRKFLGYDFWYARSGEVKRGVAKKTIVTFKRKVRELTRRKRGMSLGRVVDNVSVLVRGWKGYFHLAQTPRVFSDLDKWIRHRLRAYQLRQWKRGRTIFRELRRLGASESCAHTVAVNRGRWWRNSAMGLNSVLQNRIFDQMGLPRLAD
ncbi:MAG: group II intron reverse transcriptase/maturase [Fibrobacteres bacterium]|nr:group II intron reverse transcriptase/maturase [Fibrobacterota bacterium]